MSATAADSHYRTYIETDDPDRLARNLDSLRAVALGLRGQMRQPSLAREDGSRIRGKLEELNAVTAEGEELLRALRRLRPGRAVVPTPFAGLYVEVRSGGRYEGGWQICRIRDGFVFANAHTLEAANAAALRFEQDEAEEAERVSRRVARFFRLNFIFN